MTLNEKKDILRSNLIEKRFSYKNFTDNTFLLSFGFKLKLICIAGWSGGLKYRHDNNIHEWIVPYEPLGHSYDSNGWNVTGDCKHALCRIDHDAYANYEIIFLEDEFSPWVKWFDRNTLINIDFPGIYSIAISDEDLSNKNFDWNTNIKYIGMTNSKNGLRGRLKQFDNTIAGKSGHGGADRFKFVYPDYNGLVEKLYVSIKTFECDTKSSKPKDLLVMGEVAKHEFVCFAIFANMFDEKLPQFNDKPNSPKFSQKGN